MTIFKYSQERKSLPTVYDQSHAIETCHGKNTAPFHLHMDVLGLLSAHSRPLSKEVKQVACSYEHSCILHTCIIWAYELWLILILMTDFEKVKTSAG